jgi:hypothetical protein
MPITGHDPTESFTQVEMSTLVMDGQTHMGLSLYAIQQIATNTAAIAANTASIAATLAAWRAQEFRTNGTQPNPPGGI